ncbi:MAG: histidinol-phosphatase HisJ family protein [Candidatus Moranbacteria bacterium]|nr:histidinol-phosphatase HisJ family protein [Candidatus Moranbacteria bacterium]
MPVDHHLHFLQKNSKICSNILYDYLETGKKRGVEFFGFSEHAYLFKEAERINFNPWQQKRMIYSLQDDYLKALSKLKQENKNILIGLEIDYHPKKEKEIKAFIQACKKNYDFDFFSGSVHWIKNWGIDLDEKLYAQKMNKQSQSKYFKKYFSLIEKLIDSGLFDFVCHLDLIKLFDITPLDQVYFKKIIKALKKFRLGVEINTNGMNRPIKETFPSLDLVRILKKNQIPLTLSSDAHTAFRVGEYFSNCLRELKKNGYKKLFYCKKFKYEFIEI